VTDGAITLEGAVRTLTDDLNRTLRGTVTSYPLVAWIDETLQYARIGFRKDRVPVGSGGLIQIAMHLHITQPDGEEGGRYRPTMIGADFTYFDKGSHSSPLVEYHMHGLYWEGFAEPYLVPHLHVRQTERLGRYLMGRPMLEDFLEYLICDESTPVRPHYGQGGKRLPDEEARVHAIALLHQSRMQFWDQAEVAAWRSVNSLPEALRDVSGVRAGDEG